MTINTSVIIRKEDSVTTYTESNKILILSPIYPADDIPKGWTPVVHYFAREWVKMGYEVHVINYVANFPAPVYWVSKILRDKIASKAGFTIRTTFLSDREYVLEGVNVCRIMMRKPLPHRRYSKGEVKKALEKTIAYCENNNIKPTALLAHWSNPQLEMLYHLKTKFNVPTCYVAHGEGHFDVYGKDAVVYWNAVDTVGFRSEYIKKEFETDDMWVKPSFMCYSGIPSSYNDGTINRHFETVNRIAYVGTLIKRKYPAQIIPALVKVYGKEFLVEYAGEGEERSSIERLSIEYGVERQVKLHGRIDREAVIDLLDHSDIFIMISEGEAFGLVYLEAMARGCITIASRKEGFDGIIKHGYNGFLCEAGNTEELSVILGKIQKMTPKERKKISSNAMETAKKLTDENAARDYLFNVLKIES